MGNEHLGERWFLMDHAENSRFFQPHDDGVRHRRDRRYALRLPGQTSFSEEIVRSKNCDDCFLALLRNDAMRKATSGRRAGFFPVTLAWLLGQRKRLRQNNSPSPPISREHRRRTTDRRMAGGSRSGRG
jgi:hypothetical protein